MYYPESIQGRDDVLPCLRAVVVVGGGGEIMNNELSSAVGERDYVEVG